MNFPWSLAALAFFCSICAPALADDIDHFRKVTVSPDELRVLALAGVRELRCDYEIMPTENLVLFAELYQGGTCTARYELALASESFHDPKAPHKGTFSFGWNEGRHELVSAIQNDTRYSPWTRSAIIKDFSYMDYSFFKDSHPEQRHSDIDSSSFTIYPVAGLCGERTHQMQEFGFTDAASYVLAATRADAKNAVIIYLYDKGGKPPLHFEKSDARLQLENNF